MKPQEDHWGTKLALELVPAALFNFAVAYAVATVMRQNGLAHLAAATSVAAGIAAFLLAWYVLRQAERPHGRFALPPFQQPALEAELLDCEPDTDELLLTEQVSAPVGSQRTDSDELLLDDILESIGPDSRVVRLFDPTAMPTAGELQEQIDRHLRSGRSTAASSDATQALNDAVVALRQSLR